MIEHLYFCCYYAFLKGNLEETRMYYHFLSEEFKKKGRRDSLERDQFIQLKKIRDALKTGVFSRNEWADYATAPLREKKEATASNQVDLVRQIHEQCSSTLKDILKAREDFFLNAIEFPCGEYGKVDMYYLDSDTAFPLEVKKDRGDHALIGQIYKYDLAFRFKLHYKLYKRVQPVTVCSTYDNFTLKQLKNMGVKTIKYTMRENKLTLSDII